jgi:hypothetical protein
MIPGAGSKARSVAAHLFAQIGNADSSGFTQEEVAAHACA